MHRAAVAATPAVSSPPSVAGPEAAGGATERKAGAETSSYIAAIVVVKVVW